MKTRFLLGALLVAALVGVYWLDAFVLPGGRLLTRLVLWVVALGALREVLKIIGKRLECAPGLFPTAAIAAVVILIPALIEGKPVNPTLLVVAGVFAGGIRLLHMAGLRSAPVALPEAAALSAAFFYVIGLFQFLDRLVLWDLRAAFLVIAVSKSSDVSAETTWIGGFGKILRPLWAPLGILRSNSRPSSRTTEASLITTRIWSMVPAGRSVSPRVAVTPFCSSRRLKDCWSVVTTWKPLPAPSSATT